MATDRQNALAPGTEIDGYRIDSVLGAGGFGITYKAHEHPIGRAVAIKEYLPAGVAFRDADGATIRPLGSTEAETYAWGFSRFRDEARTLIAIDHPNIVRIHRYFEANGTGYLVMAFQDGSSLRDILMAGEALSQDEILDIVYPLLDGLAAVHAHGFLHRDIKPGNIYIGNDGRPVLIDFGSARQALSSHTRNLTAVVSGGYSPYEQYESGGNQGPWTDLYALGGVMYKCITGEMPTEAPSRLSAVVAKNNPDPMPSATEIGKGRYDPQFLKAIDMSLSILEQERPQNVREFRDLLPARTADHTIVVSRGASAGVAASAAASAIAAQTTEAPPRRAGSRALMIGGLVGISMLAAGGAGGYFLKPEDREIATLQGEIAKQQKAAADAVARARMATDRTRAAETEIAKLKQELKIARAVGGRDASKIADIQKRIATLESDLKAARAGAADLKATAEKAQKDYEAAEKRRAATQASLNSTVAELNRLRASGDPAALKKELEQARAALAQANRDKATAEAAAKSAEDALARLKAGDKAKALLAELQNARKALSDSQTKLQRSEAALRRAQAEISALKQGGSVTDAAALAQARQKLAASERALAAARAELKSAKAEVERLKASGSGGDEALRRQLAAARNEVAEARRRAAAAARTQAAARAAIAQAVQRQRVAEARYAALYRASAGIRARLFKMQRDAAFLKKRVAYWKCVANKRCR